MQNAELHQRRTRTPLVALVIHFHKYMGVLVDHDLTFVFENIDFSIITDEYKYVVVRLKLVYLMDACREPDEVQFYRRRVSYATEKTMKLFNEKREDLRALYGVKAT